ncbi:hypothetical protein SEPCBS119000_006205 [Sporothrix epigloea]|uniref:Uncharacterized protein n=1 Tax=Sporothrix epigloea TaxID=1892477 RepID=A0ABP0E5V7_9PEZI
MSLRAILSGSRVKKRTAPAPANKNKGSNGTSGRKIVPSSASVSSPWSDTLRQTKPGSGRGHGVKESEADDAVEEERGDEDFPEDEDELQDNGLVASLADDLSLRDVIQALRYARGTMFDPMPRPRESGEPHGDDDQLTAGGGVHRTGYVGNSTRVAELLNMRRQMPPLATTAHVAALLPNATMTERETVSLVRAGMLLKVVQPQWRRGFSGKGSGGRLGSGSRSNDMSFKGLRSGDALLIGGESLGEVLVETAALQALVREGPSSAALSEDCKATFAGWLGEAGLGCAATSPGQAPMSPPPNRFTINSRPAPQLTVAMVDELVRGGFLVGHGASTGLIGSLATTGHRSAIISGGRRGYGERGSQSDTGDVYARPEDRTTLLSLETVARAASGSYDAVGGVNAVYTAGGGGARGRHVAAGTRGSNEPAAGSPEDLLLSIPGHGTFVRLVSGALNYLVALVARTPHHETLESSLRERWNAGGSIAKRKGREGFSGQKRVPLSRSRKWKEFYGMNFDWILAEAVGAGLVELFDTGSVGRGVRLLS